jgi:hypothetical protein
LVPPPSIPKKPSCAKLAARLSAIFSDVPREDGAGKLVVQQGETTGYAFTFAAGDGRNIDRAGAPRSSLAALICLTTGCGLSKRSDESPQNDGNMSRI